MRLSEATLELLESLGDKRAHFALWETASDGAYAIARGGRIMVCKRWRWDVRVSCRYV